MAMTSHAATDRSANRKRETLKHQTSSSLINYNNTCEGVNPLLKTVKVPAATSDNRQQRKNDSGVVNSTSFKISSLSKILPNTRHIGKHSRRAFQRWNKTVTKDERHPSKHPGDRGVGHLVKSQRYFKFH